MNNSNILSKGFSSVTKRLYVKPMCHTIAMDNEISLALNSIDDIPEGPFESYLQTPKLPLNQVFKA